MLTRVYLCLVAFSYVNLFTRGHMFTIVYLYLLTYFYLSLFVFAMFTHEYSCLPNFATV